METPSDTSGVSETGSDSPESPLDQIFGDPTKWEPPVPAGQNRDLATEPVPMVIDPLLNESGYTWLLGKRGAYKTGLAVYIGVQVILGRDLFGRFEVPSPGPIVYLDGHENNQLLYGRIERVLNGIEATEDEREKVWSNFLVKHTTTINFHSGTWVNELTEWAAEIRPRLMIFDTFMRFYVAGGYHDEDTSQAIALNNQMQAATGTATLWLHHPPKSGGVDPFRGGSGFLDAADVAWQLQRNGDRISVKLEKYRPGPEPEDFSLRVEEETPEDLIEQDGHLTFSIIGDCAIGQCEEKLSDRIVAFLERNEGAGLNEIADAVRGKKARIFEKLKKLEGKEIYVNRDGKKHRHFLKQPGVTITGPDSGN